MSYVLHGAHGSGSAIIEIILSELALPYTLEVLSLRESEQRGDTYSALNPHHKVPTLITPQDETLTETSAIVLTLTERHPEPPLLPPSASLARARALRWMMFAASELYPIIEIVDYPERFSEDESAAASIKAIALETWRRRWQTVEAALTDGPFVLDDYFSAVDAYLAVLSRWDLPAEWRATQLPKVERLALAVATRPAVRDIWLRNFP